MDQQTILKLACLATKMPAEKIIKARLADDGSLVVVVEPGPKITFSPDMVTELSTRLAKPVANRKEESLETKELDQRLKSVTTPIQKQPKLIEDTRKIEPVPKKSARRQGR